MIRSFHSGAFLAVVATLVGVTGTGCGNESNPRSTEAFCSVMDKHKERFTGNMGSAISNVETESAMNVILGLGQTVSALGDLTIMWDELAEVAPEEISADVDKIDETYKSQLESSGDAATNLLGGLTSSLTTSLTTMGSYQRVDAFVTENCIG